MSHVALNLRASQLSEVTSSLLLHPGVDLVHLVLFLAARLEFLIGGSLGPSLEESSQRVSTLGVAAVALLYESLGALEGVVEFSCNG